MSNGDRSQQRVMTPNDNNKMIPKNSLYRIKTIKIYSQNDTRIWAFVFFDQNNIQIFSNGYINAFNMKVDTVVLEDGDVIVGVTAKT